MVRERSPEEILDIYEVRILLAGLGARLAARRRTELDLIRIRSRLEFLERIDDVDRATANRAFHQAIWSASRSAPVKETMDRLTYQIGARYPTTTLTTPGRFESSIREYKDLLKAIEIRDEDAAAAIATKHFEGAREARLAMFAISSADEDTVRE